MGEGMNVYLEGVRTSTGVWLFMARKLTGKGLLAFLLCHFIPRPRPSWQRCFAEHGRPRDGGGLFSLASRSATRDRRLETVFRAGRAYPGTSRQIQEMPHSPTVTKYICCKSLSCTSQKVWMLSVIGSRRRRAREPFWGPGTFNVGPTFLRKSSTHAVLCKTCFSPRLSVCRTPKRKGWLLCASLAVTSVL